MRGTQKNPRALLTKTFTRDPHGNIVRTTATELFEGHLRVATLNAPRELAELIQGLEPQEALMFGVPRNGVLETPLVSRARARAGAAGITRTKDDVDYPRGGGLLFLDFDNLPPGTSLVDVAVLLAQVLPVLGTAPMVLVASASSRVVDTTTGESVTGLRGVHVYVWVANACDIPEIGARLRDRTILAGYGWCFVSDSGKGFVRVPFDATVFQPTRLAYAAGALCTPPLEQRRGGPLALHQDGAPLSLDDVPALTEEERARLGVLESKILESGREESEKKKAAYRKARIENGIDPKTLDRMLEHQALEGDFPIHLADGSTASVQDILADPARFHGRECYDPEEPDYQGGKIVGKIFVGEDGTVRIHSFAHGGRVFTLVRDAETQLAEAQAEFADRAKRQVRSFSEVESRPIDWLLQNRLARREITMVNGWPGEGKTTGVIDWVAKLTRGQLLPDGSVPPRPLKVLFLSTEDNASVLKLRLRAAGADLDRVLTMDDDALRGMHLPSGRSRWVEIIQSHGIDVVVIDPMMAFVDDDLKSIAEQDARKFMEALRGVLLETGAAAVCIRHPNKATAGGHMNAVSASSGSLAFTGAARLEFLVGRAPNTEDVRALAGVKNNLGPLAPTLLYKIKSAAVALWDEREATQDVAVVEWVGVDRNICAEDLLTKRESREVRSKIAEAREFLETFLAEGPAPKADVLAAARRLGIETRTLERARAAVGWSKTHGNLRYGGVRLWGLEGQSPDDYRSARAEEPEHTGNENENEGAAGWSTEDEAALQELIG